ncbi:MULTISPECIES: non-heme iron oxygenase ferredoxin subunit [unclassified Mesorhizobium]|uniref:non-heme iron oxygenase ferredoxin subunit n=1 Tax=unclassified Mesorhizobium TaxID=325217 RepID=UPI001FDFF5E8|nr:MULTISPECIES: non-heme iron oxygenase ferredoxin subunit [unclassified Mesorhizobium]
MTITRVGDLMNRERNHFGNAMTTKWIVLCNENELGDGEMRAFEIRGALVALYRVDSKFFATSNVCSHAFGLLTDGWLDGQLVECPLHGAQFDIVDGSVRCGPATQALATYATRIAGGKVEVDLPA